MRRHAALASTALIGTALSFVGACSSDTDTNGTGGATTSSSGGTTGTAGSGGQGNAAGQGGETGGSGGSGGTGGSGGSGGSGSGFDCGDEGLTCYAPQICVKFVVTAGPDGTVTWECHDDPCAPDPVSCDCATDLCSGDPGAFCQMSQDQLECHSGGVCAAPDTPIATPSGDRPIRELAVGDRVYSLHQGQLQAVPLERVSRTPVRDHSVAEVTLSNGAILRVSVGHPTSDGRLFWDLEPGAALGEQRVVSVATVPYDAAHTYDILPASDTGTYIAGGALIGSTLRAR